MNFTSNKTNKNFDSVEYANIDGKDCVIIKNAVYFKPSDIFDCGQCFRFNKTGEEVYDGVAFSKYIRVYAKDGDIYIENATQDDFDSIWYNFFGFNRDYGEIMQSFKNYGNGGALKKAMDFCPGIRILHQDIFECLISFIISQNNNIPRIKKTVERLCSNFGEEFICGGEKFYDFPTPEKIVRNGNNLDIIKSGFRGKYIFEAAKKITGGEINLDAVHDMTTKEGIEYLMTLRGVGPKVASCVMLFGYNRLDAFPIDVWVKRILEKHYSPTFSSEDIADTFGIYAGVAQQYLFHYERSNG